MAQVLIRNLDEETVETYREKARLKGISLEQELRNLLEAHKPFTVEERVAFSRKVRAMQAGVAPSMTLEEIREGLE